MMETIETQSLNRHAGTLAVDMGQRKQTSSNFNSASKRPAIPGFVAYSFLFYRLAYHLNDCSPACLGRALTRVVRLCQNHILLHDTANRSE
jgi:hypothetical protein